MEDKQGALWWWREGIQGCVKEASEMSVVLQLLQQLVQAAWNALVIPLFQMHMQWFAHGTLQPRDCI